MDRAEWLEERRTGIGGSDIAAVCGLSRWRSPMDVYLDKIGAVGEQEQNEAMYWGLALEAPIRERFAQEHPEFTVEAIGLTINRDRENPWMLATYDGLCFMDDNIVAGWEGKTTSAWKASEWEAESVPTEYWLQCQWSMAVSGLPVWYLSVLIGGNDYREWIVERDDDAIANLIRQGEDFWQLVTDRTPPPVDGSEASKRVLDTLYPAKEAVLDPPASLGDADDLVSRHVDAVAARKAAEATEEALANELRALMGTHAVGFTDGGYRVTWKPQTRSSLDSRRLKAEKPDIAAEYVKVSEFRVLHTYEPGSEVV